MNRTEASLPRVSGSGDGSDDAVAGRGSPPAQADISAGKRDSSIQGIASRECRALWCLPQDDQFNPASSSIEARIASTGRSVSDVGSEAGRVLVADAHMTPQ